MLTTLLAWALALVASAGLADSPQEPPPEPSDQAQEEPRAPAEEAAAETDESGEVESYRRSFWGRMIARPNTEPGYRLTFRLVHDIPLPGPLPDGRPRLVDGRIAINVPGGVARTGWDAGATPDIDTGAPELPGPEAWAEGPDGRYRARFLSAGTLVVEKRCKKCRQQWRRAWKLKIPGSVLTVPLVTDDRIYFGAQDNRVYCLKKSNGHRIWDTDLERRVSRPVVLWEGTVTVEAEDGRGAPLRRHARVVLVLPDGGDRLEALDARSGRSMAQYELEVEDGRLLGVPLSTPDGKVVVAREKYVANEASLMVLALDAGKGKSGGADKNSEPAEGADPTTGRDATEGATRRRSDGAN